MANYWARSMTEIVINDHYLTVQLDKFYQKLSIHVTFSYLLSVIILQKEKLLISDLCNVFALIKKTLSCFCFFIRKIMKHGLGWPWLK